MNQALKQMRRLRFVSLIIPVFLLSAGMRAPDLSHPHKPKPMARAVMEKTTARTVLQAIAKIDIDPVTTNQLILDFLATGEHAPELQPYHPPVPILSLAAFPPRAPPTSHTLT